MKIKLSELKPNPFKKEINNGKLDEDTINKIQSNIKELGLMGALPVFKKDDKYYLVNGHHRVEALKRTFGKSFEIEVVVHNYSDENILRGMVIENLTQRNNEFREELENLVLIRKYLLEKRSPSEHISKTKPHENGSIRDIASWLNKSGEVMALGKISQILNIADKLSPELLEKVNKGKETTLENQDEGILLVKDALSISKIEDKKEQKIIAKAILESDISKHNERDKIIIAYKNAPEEIKEKVRKGEIDIKNIQFEVGKYNLEQARKQRGELRIKTIKQNINEQINYLKFSLADSKDNIKQSFKHLSILSKYFKDMNEEQREKLDNELKKYEDLFKKLSDLISQIREKING